MRDVNRRDVVKLAAGLAAGAVACGEAAAQNAPKKPVNPKLDPELHYDLTSLGTFMFAEQATTKIDDTGPSKELVITSAVLDGENNFVYVRSNQMRIFRMNAGVDEFTKSGGLHWRFGDVKGKVQFKNPGGLVMVLRDDKGTVNWYALTLDFRC